VSPASRAIRWERFKVSTLKPLRSVRRIVGLPPSVPNSIPVHPERTIASAIAFVM